MRVTNWVQPIEELTNYLETKGPGVMHVLSHGFNEKTYLRVEGTGADRNPDEEGVETPWPEGFDYREFVDILIRHRQRIGPDAKEESNGESVCG